MNLEPIHLTQCFHSRHVMHTDVQFYTITSHKLQQKVHVARARIAYNNQLIITVRSIIITHHPRKLSRARSVIVVFHLISAPAIADPRRSSPACAQDAPVSRGRVIELVYLAGPARARREKRERERRARPIVAMPRGFAIHQRHVNAFRCWFAAGVIILFIKFHHPRASAARLPARAHSRLALRRQSRKRPELRFTPERHLIRRHQWYPLQSRASMMHSVHRLLASRVVIN